MAAMLIMNVIVGVIVPVVIVTMVAPRDIGVRTRMRVVSMVVSMSATIVGRSCRQRHRR